MTKYEWATVCEGMIARWPQADWAGYTTAGALDKWGTDLADLPSEHAEVAVEALYRDGREFPPNGAQIRSKVLELGLDVPEWGEVAKTIRQCAGWVGRRDQRLEEEHPLLVAFVRQVGWAEACYAGSDDRTAEAQVREKWLAHVRRFKRDASYQGLPSAGLRSLERVNREPRQLSQALGGVLEAGPTEEAA